MPNAFLPIRLAYDQANLLGIDDEDFDRALFPKLASGSILAQSEQGLRSNLALMRFSDPNGAAKELGISAMNKSAIARAIKRQHTAHIFTPKGYITVDPEEGSFLIGLGINSFVLPGPDILPSFWNDAYIDRGSQTLISMDWRRETRSTFLRVAIDIKDLKESGLLTLSENREKAGRPSIYGDPDCDDAFLKWHRRNPQVSQVYRIKEFREIYRQAGRKVAQDEKGRAEARAIKALIARSDSGPK